MTLSPQMRDIVQRVVIDGGAPKLIEQGRRASESDGRCRYRAPSGDKCLIGQCIPDAAYKSSLEGEDASNRAILSRLGFDGVPTHDEELALNRLQNTHDRAAATNFVTSFSSNLSRFCAEYGFTLPDAVKQHVEVA